MSKETKPNPYNSQIEEKLAESAKREERSLMRTGEFIYMYRPMVSGTGKSYLRRIGPFNIESARYYSKKGFKEFDQLTPDELKMIDVDPSGKRVFDIMKGEPIK